MPQTDPARVLSATVVLLAAGASVACLCALLFILPMEAAAATAFLSFIMALITVTDVRHFIIPDVLSLPAIPAGIVANALVFHGADWSAGLTQSLSGALAGAGAFFFIRFVYQRARGMEGLGLGDVKLAAVAGAWLGPEPLAAACLVAALSALVAIALRTFVTGGELLHARSVVPFGAFIAPVILIFWIWRLLIPVLMP